MKISSILFILFLLLCTLAPGFQMQFEPIKRLRIYGVVLPEQAPSFSFSGFLSGDYQEKAEEWLMKKSGLWTYLVRSENQLNYNIFGLLSTNYDSRVVLGRNGILFEREYLDVLNGKNNATNAALEDLVRDLKKLQAGLSKKGVSFSLLLSASKAELYREEIPEEYLASGVNAPSKYTRFRKLLEKNSVPFIDGPRVLQEIEKGKGIRTFAATGTHWSEYGVCEVIRALFRQLEKQIGKELKSLRCEPTILRQTPRKPDRDLLEIANIWTNSKFHQAQLYPKTSVAENPDAYKPRMLFIGTSFIWPMLKVMERHKLYHRSDFYYYYSRNREYPSGSYRQINKAKIKWDEYVFTRDAIVIEINEAAIENVGSGFIQDALIALDSDYTTP